MKKMIVPLIAAVVGAGSGLGAAIALKPSEPPHDPPMEDHETHAEPGPDAGHGDHASSVDDGFVKMPGQFTIPILHDGKVRAMVVLSLTMEIDEQSREAVVHLLPRFQDAFLSALFDHARIGGFEGDFTASLAQSELKRALLAKAEEIAGAAVHGVLVTELARQSF
ncbi:MAG: flagellar basal body-associated protein FliL [Rhodobacterales bacterium]|nr:MAG: flagellar basal body-associated protein FliL [Rhodobacterales bacterium]